MDGRHADGETEERMVEKSDKKFSTLMVLVCCTAVILYSVFFFIYKFKNPSGTWDTAFTAAFFAFWGAELVMLASIKRSKIRNKYEGGNDA